MGPTKAAESVKPKAPVNGSSTRSSPILPRLSLKAQIRLNNTELSLLTVGGHHTFEIGEITHDALQLFDGKTTQAEAVNHLIGRTLANRNELNKSLDDLRSFLEFFKLLDKGYS
jgi:hypothetical protein